MLRTESKLAKYTLIGCALLLIAYFSTSTRADEYDDVATISVMCYAITVNLQDPDSDFWLGFTRSWIKDAGVFYQAVTQARENFNHDANKTVINNALIACAETKTAILKYEESEMKS